MPGILRFLRLFSRIRTLYTGSVACSLSYVLFALRLGSGREES